MKKKLLLLFIILILVSCGNKTSSITYAVISDKKNIKIEYLDVNEDREKLNTHFYCTIYNK